MLDDQVGSAVTHAIGVVLSLAALPVLVGSAAVRGTGRWAMISAAIYGCTLVGLYVSSTVYHAFGLVRLNLRVIQEVSVQQLGHATMPIKAAVSRALERVFQLLDHIFILLLMAGSYTPLSVLTPDKRPLLAVWTVVMLASVYRAVSFSPATGDCRLIYVVVSLVLAVALVPVVSHLPVAAALWISVGIGFLLIGIPLFLSEGLPFGHTLWHMCVLASTGCHFVAVVRYVIPFG